MPARHLKSIVPVNDYLIVHPALDFWTNRSIVSIGGKWQHNFDNGDVEFTSKPLCIMSSGEKFIFEKKDFECC